MTKKTTGSMMLRGIILSTILALGGCATVDGIGRDISGGANRVASWFG